MSIFFATFLSLASLVHVAPAFGDLPVAFSSQIYVGSPEALEHVHIINEHRNIDYCSARFYLRPDVRSRDHQRIVFNKIVGGDYCILKNAINGTTIFAIYKNGIGYSSLIGRGCAFIPYFDLEGFFYLRRIFMRWTVNDLHLSKTHVSPKAFLSVLLGDLDHAGCGIGILSGDYQSGFGLARPLERSPTAASIFTHVESVTPASLRRSNPSKIGRGPGRQKREETNSESSYRQIEGPPCPEGGIIRGVCRLPLGAKVGLVIVATLSAWLIGVYALVRLLEARINLSQASRYGLLSLCLLLGCGLSVW
ncbi:hypothetical protein [Sphingomonas sp. R86521]|uniref:hypothetical protein n=1 Tax=Sphingomonas sp. R86521 TaxID=3093860 RepID=UPI0036D3E94A